MLDGFIKVAATSAGTHVGNPKANASAILVHMKQCADAGADLVVFPELCLTGCSCGDLFYSEALLSGALGGLQAIAEASHGLAAIFVVGLPFRYAGRLYNTAAIVSQGLVLGLVPKAIVRARHDGAWFSSGSELPDGQTIELFGSKVPFGTRLLFSHKTVSDYTFAIEIGDECEAPISPAITHCLAGATILVHPTSAPVIPSQAAWTQTIQATTSDRLMCGYISAYGGDGESTTDVVYSQAHLITEGAAILAKNDVLTANATVFSEIDVASLAGARARSQFGTGIKTLVGHDTYTRVCFDAKVKTTALTRTFASNPFLPTDQAEAEALLEQTLQVQTAGLVRRITHTHAKCVVLGISGGLDSALALLVAIRAMNALNRPVTDVVAVTMPCFGTSSRTKSNAVLLCEALGVSFREIDIKEAVTKHLADLGHDPELHDVTYENAQARTRTQLLMNLSNSLGGFVVGTGDLSELALGFATYNGDHMSNYGINASIPKTLVRALVRYEALKLGSTAGATLLDIIDTPVSPELLPADAEGSIAQKTEDLVGPYELHDFFLYYYVGQGFTPAKLARIACYTFSGIYDEETIQHWLRTFVRRFTTQQFKRSCLPDGPKATALSLSPRGDWRMPSDAEMMEW